MASGTYRRGAGGKLDANKSYRFPEPHVYEEEYVYWPWGQLIEAACDLIAARAPARALVIDYMAGTGYLLDRLSRKRSDLRLHGVSLDGDHIAYGRRKYPHLTLIRADADSYVPEERPDVVVCTAGIHHLNRTSQRRFVRKVASELDRAALFVVGEEVIRPYGKDDADRLASVVELGTALIRHVADQKAPKAVLRAAIDMLSNDVVESEYKLDMDELRALLSDDFIIRASQRTWPEQHALYGDVLLECERL